MLRRNIVNFPAMGWPNSSVNMDDLARRLDLLTNAMYGRPGLRTLPSKVFPAVNITEDKDRYFVRAELPGVTVDDLSLEVTAKNLALTGERKIQSEGEKARYHRKEREAGKFSRIVDLPGEVNADSVDAKLVNGVLTVAIAKSAATQSKKITVKTS